jgi:hypothetical protein
MDKGMLKRFNQWAHEDYMKEQQRKRLARKQGVPYVPLPKVSKFNTTSIIRHVGKENK